MEFKYTVKIFIFVIILKPNQTHHAEIQIISTSRF
jgi:hypothetical protein